MPYDPNMEENLNKIFPDPQKTPHDEVLSNQVRSDLAFLPDRYYVWVNEDGQIFIDSLFPLTPELSKAVQDAGYQLPQQATIGMGRVQYRITKVQS